MSILSDIYNSGTQHSNGFTVSRRNLMPGGLSAIEAADMLAQANAPATRRPRRMSNRRKARLFLQYREQHPKVIHA